MSEGHNLVLHRCSGPARKGLSPTPKGPEPTKIPFNPPEKQACLRGAIARVPHAKDRIQKIRPQSPGLLEMLLGCVSKRWRVFGRAYLGISRLCS